MLRLRTTLQTLRQPRYVALTTVMAVIAIACIAAGTWQIARFENKVHENDSLRENADRPAVAVSELLPLVGAGAAPSSDDVEFRTVTATGTYLSKEQSLVRNRTVDGRIGYLVLTPLRTAEATLLVIRGFVPLPRDAVVPTPAVAPAGTVQIVARAHPPESRNDGAAALDEGQLESINPGEQADRLGTALYNGYVEIEAGQPGTRGLVAMSKPDLSNPAGGALEPQHFAYVIQWYLFAILALAAPVVMARAETRGRKDEDIDIDIDADDAPKAGDEPAAKPTAEALREAKLADRYGRPVR